MPKQLLFYQSTIPVSGARHYDACLEAENNYGFSAGINAVPLMAVEFIRAATEYAIVFTTAGEDVLPAAVLGVRSDQNLYLDEKAQWRAEYIPAFVRRYPFVFSTSEDGKTLTLCIDESHPGFNRAGRGQRLFGEDYKPTAFVEQVLKFLQEYQSHFERTKAFGKRLKELGLLETMQAQVSTPSGEKLSVGGFMAVSRQKLRDLSGDALASLAKTDELELLYLHLYSMRNFNEVKDRLMQSMSTVAKVAEPEAAV
jgi:hypothetical protein